MEVELGLHAREGRLTLAGDEDGLGAERRLPCRRGQGVPGLRDGHGSERRMALLDPEPVQARDPRKRASRLRHHLGADPVSREARNRVRRAPGHAGTPSKTS